MMRNMLSLCFMKFRECLSKMETDQTQAWDAISRYLYAAIEGGSIMRSWMKDENTMIACCNDGTRPVIFKIERIDYE